MSKHRVRYQNNLVEGNVKAICSCGWWVEDEQYIACQKGQEHIANPEPKPVDELALKRFEKSSVPSKNNPFDALEVARAWMLEEQAAGRPIEHVIIFTGRTTEDGSSAHRFFQAGSYIPHAQYGLVDCGRQMLHDS